MLSSSRLPFTCMMRREFVKRQEPSTKPFRGTRALRNILQLRLLQLQLFWKFSKRKVVAWTALAMWSFWWVINWIFQVLRLCSLQTTRQIRNMPMRVNWVRPLTWMLLKILNIWSEQQAFQKSSHVVIILEAFLNWGQTSWTILEKPSLAWPRTSSLKLLLSWRKKEPRPLGFTPS